MPGYSEQVFKQARRHELIYGNAFFPFQQPLEVLPEDRIDVRLEARFIGDDYTWRWDTTLWSQECEV